MKKPKTDMRPSYLIGPFYKFILPLITIISLLFISSKISRPLFLNSALIDILARVWLCIMFCMGYIIFSDLEKYKKWFYGGKVNDLTSQTDVQAWIWNIIMGVMLGIFATIISWWTMQTFLPFVNGYALALALLNGVLFSFPMFFQYRHFRL